jgi:hypothetical protein
LEEREEFFEEGIGFGLYFEPSRIMGDSSMSAS